MEDSVWGRLAPPPPDAASAAGECHLWPVPVVPRPGWLDLLDHGEQAQAERFRVDSARDIFVTSRAAQRLIAGRYLNRAPQDVSIVRVCPHCGADHGRPRVDGAGWDYSVSHTAKWLVVAVAHQGLVGVDLEDVTTARPVDDLAQHVLTPAEHERFGQTPPGDRTAWFLRAWTRKEAVIKLTGHGLRAQLDQLDVSGSVAATTAPPPGWPSGPIHLLDVPAGEHQRAALATTVLVRNVVRCGPVPG